MGEEFLEKELRLCTPNGCFLDAIRFPLSKLMDVCVRLGCGGAPVWAWKGLPGDGVALQTQLRRM